MILKRNFKDRGGESARMKTKTAISSAIAVAIILVVGADFAYAPSDREPEACEPQAAAARDGIAGTWKCEMKTEGPSAFYLETWTINADGTARFGTRQGRASYAWERTGQTNAEGAEEYRFDLIDGTEEGNPPSDELYRYYSAPCETLLGKGDDFVYIRQ